MRIQTINNQYNSATKLRQNEPATPQPVTTTAGDTVSFKAKKPGLTDKVGEKVGEFFGKVYAEKLLNKEWVHKVSEKLSGASDLMTQHMATAGSILTSGVYMYKTMTNKDMDPNKRTTLMINQGACLVIPTICAYAVDHLLKDNIKNLEKRYSGLKMQQMATGALDAKKCEALKKSFNRKLGLFGALAGLVTFTTIYRYLTPVLVTPGCNMIGEYYNKKRAAKEAAAKQEAEKTVA